MRNLYYVKRISSTITKMASTFTLFPRLPPELRLQVWQLALRPFSTHKGGLNHISVIGKDGEDEADAKPIILADGRDGSARYILEGARLQCNRAQNGVSSNPIYRSACLWDSGLLTACKESRDVIMRRYKKYQQNTQLSPWEDDEPSCCTYFQRPSIMYVPDRDEHWYILFQQHKDLVCFTFQGWEILSNYPVRRYACGFTDSCRLMCPYLEFPWALEFDASWALNWPEGHHAILNEASPRGVLARVQDSQLGDLDACSIWLIDRYAAPVEISGSQESPCRTFYDMDQEYVESKDVSAEISEFLDKLDELMTDEDKNLRDDMSEYDWIDDDKFEMDKCVKALVRRTGGK